MKKRWLSLALALVFCLSLVPVTAGAATDYGLSVGGMRVTSDNASDVFGDGKVSYDSDTKTLTLNGYSYSAATAAVDSIQAGIYSENDLVIELVGTNSVVEASTNGEASYGIYVDLASNLTFKGSGTLTVSGTTACVTGATNCGISGGEIVFGNGFK